MQGTLAQDRQYVFDLGVGLYRGETSFLDWREQTYPGWTAEDVRFIGESHALSTNVLHYQALRMAQAIAQQRGDATAARYQQWADALRTQIDRRFWREEVGQYMSYIGPAGRRDENGASALLPVAKYDLLGLALGVLAEVFPPERARRALANTWPPRPAARWCGRSRPTSRSTITARSGPSSVPIHRGRRGGWTMRRGLPWKSNRSCAARPWPDRTWRTTRCSARPSMSRRAS